MQLNRKVIFSHIGQLDKGMRRGYLPQECRSEALEREGGVALNVNFNLLLVLKYGFTLLKGVGGYEIHCGSVVTVLSHVMYPTMNQPVILS